MVDLEAEIAGDGGTVSGGSVSQRLRCCSGVISSRSTDIGRDGDQGNPPCTRISSKTPRISARMLDRPDSWGMPVSSGCTDELVALSNNSLIGRSRANSL